MSEDTIVPVTVVPEKRLRGRPKKIKEVEVKEPVKRGRPIKNGAGIDRTALSKEDRIRYDASRRYREYYARNSARLSKEKSDYQRAARQAQKIENN